MAPFLKWLAATALAIGGASALAGQLSPRVRLLLLFSAGFGLLTGWAAAVLADEFGARRSRSNAAVLCVLTAAGLVNVAWAGYRQTVAAARRISESDSQQMLALRVLEGTMGADPVLQQRFREERARLQPQFQDYLAFRLHQFGTIPAPWPAVAWGAELFFGTIAAAWMFRKGDRKPENSKFEIADPPSPPEAAHPSTLDPRP